MLHTSLGYILARSFPECAMILIVSKYLLSLDISIKTLLKKTVVLGLAISLIRMLPISFGIHTIIGMGIILFVLVNLSKDSFINCIMTLCKIFLSLILSELVYIKLLTIVFKVPEEVFLYNYTIKGAIYTLPSLIIFMLIAFGIEFVMRKFNKGSLEKVSEELNRGDFI